MAVYVDALRRALAIGIKFNTSRMLDIVGQVQAKINFVVLLNRTDTTQAAKLHS